MPEGFDARVYALTPGNASFLMQLGAWTAMPQDRLVPVHAMRIYGDQASTLEFDAYGAGVPELAWIVEDAVLQNALWRDIDAQVLAPAHCERLLVDDEKVILELKNKGTIAAKLIVGADGARSFVRAQAGIEAAESDYGQSAVVANFRCERPHANTAWQWFQRGAVLALLPLPGNHVSMVWSLPTAEVERIKQHLCREVEDATRRALGELELVTPPRSYPLHRLSAARLVAPRVALAGDAAHVIHP